MRVAYITVQFPVASETFAGGDVRELLKQGVDVEVFSLKQKKANTSNLLRDWALTDLKINHAPSYMKSVLSFFQASYRQPFIILKIFRDCFDSFWEAPLKTLRSLMFIFRAIEISNILKDSKFDAIHLFWGHFPSIVGLALKYANCKVPVTIFLGAYDLEMRLNISRQMLLMADGIFTHSETNRSKIRALAGKAVDIKVIHRGLDVERLTGLRERAATRPKEISVVSVSRLVKCKKVAELIQVIAILRSRGWSGRLKIIGDGPEYKRLRRLVSDLRLDDRIEFLGLQPHSRVISEIQKSHVFALLSQCPSERLPNAVKEAMFFGLSCIVSKSPGISELVTNERDGFILALNDDLNHVADLILRLSSLGERLDRTGVAAHEKIVEKFSLGAAMNKYRLTWLQLNKFNC